MLGSDRGVSFGDMSTTAAGCETLFLLSTSYKEAKKEEIEKKFHFTFTSGYTATVSLSSEVT